MKIDIQAEPAVIAIIHEIDRQATRLERAGKRQVAESARMRELSAAVTAKFRALKQRMETHGRRN